MECVCHNPIAHQYILYNKTQNTAHILLIYIIKMLYYTFLNKETQPQAKYHIQTMIDLIKDLIGNYIMIGALETFMFPMLQS